MTSNQYKLVYNKLFNQLPKWKQIAVKEDSIKNNWSGVLTEFIKNVIVTAETEYKSTDLLTKNSDTNIVSNESIKKKVKKVKDKKS
jgi:hypothetical protein